MPFFLEEVTKVVLETADGADPTKAHDALAALAGARYAVPARFTEGLDTPA